MGCKAQRFYWNIRIGNPGDTLHLAGARLGIKSFPVALFAHFERCRHIHSNITDNNIQKTLGFTAQPTDFPGDKTNPGDIQITMLFGVGWAVKPNVFIGLWGFLECC
ncbi:MAG: hypothetical protein VR65_22495 [Desulfobulbaceae bacterium BRH_c16a]|nr:MAG: hypothetical protein VR65_22495 [Desulfobulbaceae bacterium BRH_c16a]